MSESFWPEQDNETKDDTISRVIRILELEAKKFKKIDIILSERELEENKKTVALINSLIEKIKESV